MSLSRMSCPALGQSPGQSEAPCAQSPLGGAPPPRGSSSGYSDPRGTYPWGGQGRPPPRRAQAFLHREGSSGLAFEYWRAERGVSRVPTSLPKDREAPERLWDPQVGSSGRTNQVPHFRLDWLALDLGRRARASRGSLRTLEQTTRTKRASLSTLATRLEIVGNAHPAPPLTVRRAHLGLRRRWRRSVPAAADHDSAGGADQQLPSSRDSREGDDQILGSGERGAVQELERVS